MLNKEKKSAILLIFIYLFCSAKIFRSFARNNDILLVSYKPSYAKHRRRSIQIEFSKRNIVFNKPSIAFAIPRLHHRHSCCKNDTHFESKSNKQHNEMDSYDAMRVPRRDTSVDNAKPASTNRCMCQSTNETNHQRESKRYVPFVHACFVFKQLVARL